MLEVYTIKSKNIKGAKYEAVFLAKNKPPQVEEQEASKNVDDR